MNAQNTAIGTSCLIQARTGAPAGSGGQGTLIAQLTGNASAFGVVSNGVLTSNAITQDSSADATGTVAHYELLTSGAVFLESGILNEAGTDGLSIDNADVNAGQVVQFNGNWVRTAAYDDGV